MSDTTPTAAPSEPVPAAGEAFTPARPATVPPPHHQAPAHLGGSAALGSIRGTGMCIVLTIVTLGIYSLVWFFKTHDEMKKHSGNGIGGGLALVLSLFVGPVTPFFTSSEVGALYQRAGQTPPVSGMTALWYFPGVFILVGPIVWFVKTNGALNDYWRAQGVTD